MSSPSKIKIYDEIREALLVISHLHARQEGIRAILRGATVTLVLFFLLVSIEKIWMLPGRGRWGLIAAGAAVVLTAVLMQWRYWTAQTRPFKGEAGLEYLAIVLGRLRGEHGDRLGNALAVYHQNRESGLSIKALKDAWKEFSPGLVQQTFLPSSWKKEARLFVLVVLTMILLFLISGVSYSRAVWRLMHPGVVTPPLFSLSLTIDRAWCVQGDSVSVTLTGQGSLPAEVMLERVENGMAVRALSLPPGGTVSVPVRSDSLLLRAVHGRITSQWQRVAGRHRPLVKSMQLRIHPPRYTQLKAFTLPENQGHGEALPGSRVEIGLQSSEYLNSAGLEFESGLELPLMCRENSAAGQFILKSSEIYRIRLTDSLHLTNDQPIAYRLRTLTDLPPSARIVSPPASLDLDESMTLSLLLHASDDYGISRLALGYTLIQPGRMDTAVVKYITLQADSMEDRSHWVRMDWPVDTLSLLPGDAVACFFEAWDNDGFNGPKQARSRVLIARFPSMEEIFEGMNQQQDQLIGDVESLLDEGKQISRSLEEVAQKLKTGQDLAWEDRQKLESALDRQKAMKEKSQALKEEMQQTVEALDDRQMADLETLEKYRQIQEIFQSLESPELKAAARQLQQAMMRERNEALEAALENFQMDQKALEAALDRTLNLLKRAVLEQRLEGLIRQVESLMVSQQSINDSETARGIDREIQSQMGGVKAAEREMTDLLESMRAIPGTPVRILEETANAIEKREIAKQLARQAQAAETNRKAQAVEAGQQSLSALSDWKAQLDQVKKVMEAKQNQKLTEALARYGDRMMQLSQLQETLTEAAAQGQMTPRETAPGQQALRQHLDQLTDSLMALSKEAFFMPPDLSRVLGKAMQAMDLAVEQMGETGRPMLPLMGEALGNLNRGLMEMEKLSDGSPRGQGQGSAMDQLMAGLQSLTEEQQAIQRQTMDMLGQGGLSAEQQAAARRLGGQQRALQEKLESLLDAYARQARLEGRLDELGREMEAVARDLEKALAGRETVQREQRIISRLLEAQHAAREQDLGRRREARGGLDRFRPSPGMLKPVEASWQAWRERMLKIGKEGYTADYQALIRKYFEALMREEATGNRGGRQ